MKIGKRYSLGQSLQRMPSNGGGRIPRGTMCENVEMVSDIKNRVQIRACVLTRRVQRRSNDYMYIIFGER